MLACSRRSNRWESARDVTTIRTPGTGYGTDAKGSDLKSDFLSCIEITEIIVTLKLHQTDRIFIFWRLLWSLTFPYVTQKVRYIFLFFKGFLSSVNTQTVIRQLLVFGVTPFKMGEDKTWTRGAWTPTLDQVHAPLSWTGSMDHGPPVIDRVHGQFFLIMRNEQNQK